MLSSQIIELQNAVGSNEKCRILKEYKSDEDFCRFLYFALNPFITYNLSEKTLRSGIDACGDNGVMYFNDIFDCCMFLSNLRGIDNATINHVVATLCCYPDEEREIYVKMLAKTLRLGVTAKTVNKVIPDLIPTWEVQQAYPIEKYPINNGTKFWLTQKLNGVRATYYKGQLIARSGVPYEGLDHIINQIQTHIIDPLHLYDIVLDGELTLFSEHNMSDNEAFRTATGIINSDAEDKTCIGFTVFDVLKNSVLFESDSKEYTYSVRRELLNQISQNPKCKCDSVRILPILYCGTDLNQIDIFLNKMVSEDKEGLMLNTDVPYKRTRHKGILKVKRFYTMDLTIIRCEEGEGRLAGTLGAFVLSFNGNEVKVGSGFSDAQRKMFWDFRKSIPGTLCEVKYKEISTDKNTKLESLQFPVFVRLRTDKTEPSYG